MPMCPATCRTGNSCPFKARPKFNGFCGIHKTQVEDFEEFLKDAEEQLFGPPPSALPLPLSLLPKRLRLLELFCGTGSIGKVAKEFGFEVISVDLNKKAKPTFCTDILQWEYKCYPVGYFDVIWASPPCDTFSILKSSWIGRELKRFPGQVYTRELMLREQESIGVPILNKTKEIIDYFKPKHYWIENPQTGRMKDYMTDYKHTDVCYCMYGFDYKKPTRIWHNKDKFEGKTCNHKGKHARGIGNKNAKCVNTLNERYSIPPALVKDMFLCMGCN